jgi:hypothetical protein
MVFFFSLEIIQHILENIFNFGLAVPNNYMRVVNHLLSLAWVLIDVKKCFCLFSKRYQIEIGGTIQAAL